MDFSGSGWGPMTGSCEHSNEPSGSIRGWEFFDQPDDCLLASQDGLFTIEVGR